MFIPSKIISNGVHIKIIMDQLKFINTKKILNKDIYVRNNFL